MRILLAMATAVVWATSATAQISPASATFFLARDRFRQCAAKWATSHAKANATATEIAEAATASCPLDELIRTFNSASRVELPAWQDAYDDAKRSARTSALVAVIEARTPK